MGGGAGTNDGLESRLVKFFVDYFFHICGQGEKTDCKSFN